MQGNNRPEVHAGYGTHGKPVNGYGKSGRGMGAAQDRAAGERNPAIDAEGGEKMTKRRDVEMWQLMYPAAGQIKSLCRTPLARFRVWLRRRYGI